MKLNKIVIALAVVGLVAGSLAGQEAASKAKVLGSWDVEVSAEGQTYYLSMKLVDENGAFAGTMSEQNGMITDAPLSSLAYDGTTLSFEFNSPTPPDGVSRLLQVSMTWAGDALEGSMTIPDLGMTIPAKATKKS